jgi:hypothetical protein
MSGISDPQRRPVYYDRANNRFLLDPVGSGPWPVVSIEAAGNFSLDSLGSFGGNVWVGRTASSGTLQAYGPEELVGLINVASTAQIDASRVVAGTTSGAGVVSLVNAVNNTSTTTAATPNAVKAAYDLAETANNTATSAASTASNAESVANGASAIANAASSTANSALSTANAASSTAVAASSAAASAQTTANNAANAVAGVTSTANTALSTANSAQSTATAAQSAVNNALLKAGDTMTGTLLIGSTGSLAFEGSSENDFETTLSAINPTSDNSISLPNASGTLALLSAGQTFTGANQFTNATGQIFRRAAATDGILVRGSASGTQGYTVELAPAALSGSRTLTAPNASGTIITTGDTGTVTSAMILDGTIVNTDVAVNAGISYSKLSLTGSIVNADIATGAGIAYSKLSLANSIVNADIAAGAAIVDSKLATITTAGKVSGTAITSGNISTSGSFATTSSVAVGQASAASNTDLDVNGTYAGNVVAVAALDVDCSAGNYFTKSISGNSTFTFSNVAASRAVAFTLEVAHNSGTITWPAAVKWPYDLAPTLTTGKTHLFFFVTDDGGSRWRGSALTDYTT